MNKKVTKIIAICLCAALCLGGAGVAFAQTGSKQESAQPTAAQKATDLQQKMRPFMCWPAPMAPCRRSSSATG